MFDFDIDWYGLILPAGYLSALAGTFITFSTVYRKRQAAKSASLEPWFGPISKRNIYLSLLELQAEGNDNKDSTSKKEKGKSSAVKVPPTMLRAALLRRAVEDIHRIIQVRTAKQACTALLQRGSVGEDLMKRLERAEQEMEAELRDVVLEANGLVDGWGQVIFQTANAMAGNERLRKKLEAVEGELDDEVAWWDNRRATIQAGLLAEVEEEAAAKGDTSSKDKDTVTKETSDGVVVEKPTPAAKTPNKPAAGGGKKKKGKK